MKTKSISLTQTALVLLGAGMLGATILNAAEPKPDAPPPAERVRPGGGPGFRGPILDDQQRTLLREAMEKHRSELAALDEKMRAAQKDLAKVILSEKPDEKVLREKLEAVSKIQTEQSFIRAKVVNVIAPTLKPEQREQLENNPFALRMLLEGPAGRPGGGPPPQR